MCRRFQTSLPALVPLLILLFMFTFTWQGAGAWRPGSRAARGLGPEAALRGALGSLGPAAPPAAASADTVQTGPVFSLAANAAAVSEVYAGWPLLLQTALLHPLVFRAAPNTPPLVLAAGRGPWWNAVRFEITNARGEKADWPLHPPSDGAPTLALDARAAGEAAHTWWLSPEETARIPEGEYRCAAVLDTTDAPNPGAWKGRVRSDRVSVRFRREPERLVEHQRLQKGLLLAELEVVRGNTRRALEQVDSLLWEMPRSVGALSAKGDILAATGQLEGACRYYGLALEVCQGEKAGGAHPPLNLLRKRSILLSRFLDEEP